MTDPEGAKPGPKRGGEEGMKSLGKLMKILESFSSNDRALTLAEICARTGYPRSTAHRLMASLRDVGLLEQDKERDSYRLGLKLFELGNIALSNMEIHREAFPHVEALQRLTGYTTTVAIFDGYRAVVIRRMNGTGEVAQAATLVEHAPAHCTSVGKAALAYQPQETIERVISGGLQRFTDTTITDGAKLLAELASIRGNGYAVDEGEHQPGLRCIGAPIRNQFGHVYAGLSISASSWLLKKEDVEELAKVVKYHAERISSALIG